MIPIRTILHPTDFSEHSDFAFRLACVLARDSGAKLVLLHVARQPLVIPIEGVIPPEPERYEEELTDLLRRFQEEHPKVAMEPRLVLAADPAGAILEVAQEIKPDIIVLGTHGRTGLGRLLMGSVAEQVVRRAHCPVLTAKPPPPRPRRPAKEPAAEHADEVLEVTRP